MAKPKGRTALQLQRLKDVAWDLARGGVPNEAILQHLAGLDMGPVSDRSLRRWLAERFTASREELKQACYDDVMYLRSRAHRATALTEVNRANVTERAYWWGLYVSVLHIVLREAMKQDAGAALPTQFFIKDLNKWYEDIRAIRQMTPPLAPPEEDIAELERRMQKFQDTFGKDIRLPTETL